MKLNRLVKQLVGNKFQDWLNKRIPAANEITLSQRSIFIVPSKTGWMFCLLLVLLLITAINYQNSLIYGLVFWLFSIAISAMIFTYRNLSGLTIKIGEPVMGFVGDNIEVPVRLVSHKRSYHGLELRWNDNVQQADIAQSAYQKNAKKNNIKSNKRNSHESARAKEVISEVRIPYPLVTRGKLTTKRLRLQTRYPFGLYTCWTWIRLNNPGLVYPKPIITPYIASEGEGNDQQTDANLVIGNDEFLGLRSYQLGDSLKHIAWKYLAKGKGLLTKEYDNQQLSMQWFDWNTLQGKTEEDRLSHITGWVLQAESEGRAYGIKLPNQVIAPNIGDAHRRHCLKQLALYNLAEDVQANNAVDNNAQGSIK